MISEYLNYLVSDRHWILWPSNEVTTCYLLLGRDFAEFILIQNVGMKTVNTECNNLWFGFICNVVINEPNFIGRIYFINNFYLRINFYPNLSNPIQTLIVALEKENKKSANGYSSFLFDCQLQIFK